MITYPATTMMLSQAYRSGSDPAPAPAPPPPPRMTKAELDGAVVDLATRFADASKDLAEPSCITADELKRQLGKVPPATQKLIELAIGDSSVGYSLRSAVSDDGWLGYFNAGDVTTADLAELKAEVQRNQGKALGFLRQAVRVGG